MWEEGVWTARLELLGIGADLIPEPLIVAEGPLSREVKLPVRI